MAPRRNASSPLLAVLLVASSSRGTSLSFRYPRRPALEKRYSKVRYHVAAAGDEQRHGAAPHSTARANGRDGSSSNVAAPVGMQDDEMADEFDDAGSTLSEDLDVTSPASSGSSDDGDATGAEDEAASDVDGGVASSRRDDFELAASSSAGGTAATREAIASWAAVAHARKRQRAYQQYLGYDCDLLASLLAPKRELCHQKFELVIDDLAFIGHPVCVDNEGRWDPQGTVAASLAGVAPERGRDTTRRADDAAAAAAAAAPAATASTPPPMTLFHFVLVLDRPDPSPDLPALDLTSWLQIFYDNIAFKMTSALYAEEVRCGYVSRECEKIGLLRERCMDDGQSYASFLTHAIHVSSLARSLQQVHSSISLSSDAFVTINESIDAHLQLPPMLRDPARMMKMADVETPIDVNDAIFTTNNGANGMVTHVIDAEQVMYEQWNRTTGPFLLPWKTLLLLHDQRPTRRTGRDGENDDDDDEAAAAASDMPGPGDKGIEAWARKFTTLLKPTLDGIPTLADVADLLDWSLEDDVFPMVRHLIYYREARVVDVPRIQNYYAVSPSFDLTDLAKLSTSWSIRFATLAPLPLFLASLSSRLRPFSAQLNGRRLDQRQLCLDALIWLLRHEVVIQMHVRLRLVASEACKRRAALARDEERERIKRKRIAIAARTAKAEQAKADNASSTAVQGRPIDDGDDDDDKEANPDDHSTTVVSALSATRPDAPPSVGPSSTSPGGGHLASGLAMTPTTSIGQQDRQQAAAAAAAAYESNELKFERRAVLRSRSPSRTLAAMSVGTSGSAAATTTKTTSSGSSGAPSRSGTPRGRGRRPMPAQEASAIAATGKDVATSKGPINVVEGAGEALPSSVSSASAAVAHASSGTNRNRSPSRARMRVTGFGADEEVHLEREAAAAATAAGDAGVGHVIKPSWASKTPPTAYAELKGVSLRDEARRLSLVGEEEHDGDGVVVKSADKIARSETASDGKTKLAEGTDAADEKDDIDADAAAAADDDDDDDEDEDDVYINFDIEQEPWETRPEATVIAEPSRASGDENEWIAAMVDGRDAWLVERLYKLLPFLNGKHTVDEVVYRLEWRRKELRAVLAAFRDDILTLVHP